MIKQLMKKHFVAPSSTIVPMRHEDAKAAYLRHAEESAFNDSATTKVESKIGSKQLKEPNHVPA